MHFENLQDMQKCRLVMCTSGFSFIPFNSNTTCVYL